MRTEDDKEKVRSHGANDEFQFSKHNSLGLVLNSRIKAPKQNTIFLLTSMVSFTLIYL